MAAFVAVAASTTLLSGVASAADPAPRDRTRPVITGFKVTPALLCRDYYTGFVPTRKVAFTLSEAARVRLIKQPLVLGFLPLAPMGVTIPLAAGAHLLGSAASEFDVNEPNIFPFSSETTIDGIFGLEAKDAAGNKSATKWSTFLRWGDYGSSRGSGTNGCP